MRGKLLVLWSWLAAAMLAVCTIAVAFYASRLAE
jgi:hypothetical protein